MSNPIALRLGLTSLVATTGIVVYSLNPTVNKPPPSSFPKPPPGYAAAAAPVGSGSRPSISTRFHSEKRQINENASSVAYANEKREGMIEANTSMGRVPEFYDTMPANGMHQDL